ncbi:hypothetical protein F0562_004962 [Nyssa sinensis]|uniref:RING-type domain-containing protein n=1 Tax=Nyssa sinensis TaxID=561372 RepID=A0A5J5AGW7_9ASTE|nr:hypothetical protein F0562_004962 [Nyssa sinensis]
MVMAIVISLILLFVAIGVLVLIHVCIVGRAFSRGFDDSIMVERRSFGSTSMSQDDLEKLPCFDFEAREKGSSPVDCAVCLDNFKVGDKCRLLPLCKHSFHAQCVDSWLLKTPICPICRTSADTWKGASSSGGESSHFSENGIDLRGSQTTENSHRSEIGIVIEGQTTGSGHLSEIQLREGQTTENTHLSDTGVEPNENKTASDGAELSLREGQTRESSQLSGSGIGIGIELSESQTTENTNLSDAGVEPNENQTASNEALLSLNATPFYASAIEPTGHTIPILHLARLLLHRRASVTIFTTTANRAFISKSLAETNASIIDLPFPENIDGLPPGIESTDKLPSMSLFVSFANATKLIKPDFERVLETLPHVTFMVSDGFLCWTLESANKFGIPRLVYHGMSNYAMAVCRDAGNNRLLSQPRSDDDELFPLTNFPHIKLTRNDFEPQLTDPEPKGPYFEFIVEMVITITQSYGVIVNSFYELEPLYSDYWNNNCEPKSWCVGPLCLAELQSRPHQKPRWVQWLDQKLAQGSSVLYVAFGSQAEISAEQLREIATGLEESKVNFLWVARKIESEFGNGFEERVKDRGIVVREWVDQREILGHESVQGFLSHCGWNSVLESMCAKVPLLAWPMMAEQPLNARLVTEELKVGLRVETCNGSVRGFVKWEGLVKTVRELMEGEMGKEARRKVKEVGEAAKKAMEEGGSSWSTLNELINEIQARRHT